MTSAQRVLNVALAILIGISLNLPTHAGDWPMWRYDAGRTATSPDDLPSELRLSWAKLFSPRKQTWDDVLNNDLMQYDRVFEPIVVGNRVIVGFNDSDKVVCWDIRTGEEKWRYYTDGPVRFPPACSEGQVFVSSDDGFLYSLNAEDGRLHWKFRGGPNGRKVLGNRRVISMWPARGGPVAKDGHVYFAASIWPFMGTFLYDLDANTGEVVWVNDRTSATYIKQPHSAPSFAGIAPQGALAVTGDRLIVPGGRSVPAVFDRLTGELSHFLLNAGGKGNGGTFVMAHDDHYYVHTRKRGVRRFDVASGKKTALMLNEPVLDGKLLITSDEQHVKAIESNQDGSEKETIWQVEVDGSQDLIRAGKRLYVAGQNEITIIELRRDGEGDDKRETSTQIIQRLPCANVARLVAGGDSLIAVTMDGRIQCYRTSAEAVAPDEAQADPVSPQTPEDSDAAVQEFLARYHANDGYALAFGVAEDDKPLLDQLVASELHTIAVSADPEVVDRLRRHYDARNLYGSRITIHVGNPKEFAAPSYIANLVLACGTSPEDLRPGAIEAMFQSVRPYGGLLWLPNVKDKAAASGDLSVALDGLAQVSSSPMGVVALRSGPLEGAAPWTHMYGNAANTVKSDDRLVKAPLGILWFGGNTHHDVLPRHSHAPAEQVIGGRLFVEGVNSMSARDVYTGRLLWRREFENLGTEGIYFDKTYADTPLSTRYNQVHIPGANARGTNFVAAEDGIYLVIGDHCEVLDPRTGETRKTIVLPKEVNRDGKATWTYIGLVNGALVAGVDFANRDDATSLLASQKGRKKRGAAWSPEWFASRRIAVLDAESGALLWHCDARYSFLHNGIVAGDDTIFLLDKLPASIEEQRSRRGLEKPSDYVIRALNLKSGESRWDSKEQVFGTWLGYSSKHRLLIHAGAAAPDRAMDEVDAGILAMQADSGKLAWHNKGLRYSGPCIIHNDRIIMNSRSYAKTSGVVNILDGKPVLLDNPITGGKSAWAYKRAYGCNTAVASEYLLTFRSGAAGYYDLNMRCGVANLGGFRSGCSSNLIAADGVLNAPDFTRTCSCGYQNQTSLALIHMPDVDVWTLNPFERPEGEAGFVSRLGINFGAAGTRRADDGTVWIEYPPASESRFPITLTVEGESPKYSRRHSSTRNGKFAWVHASGLQGFSSVQLEVADPSDKTRQYTVRLHFSGKVDDGACLVEGTRPNHGEDNTDGDSHSGDIKRFSPITAADGKIRIDVQREDSTEEAQLSGIEVIALEK